ncbi:MAG: hypothetical protein WAV05_01185 [Anaerolineales bacterium]
MSADARLAEVINEPVNEQMSIVINIIEDWFHASQYIRIFLVRQANPDE